MGEHSTARFPSICPFMQIRIAWFLFILPVALRSSAVMYSFAFAFFLRSRTIPLHMKRLNSILSAVFPLGSKWYGVSTYVPV